MNSLQITCCPTCRSELNLRSECLPCLLGIGLAEAAGTAPQADDPPAFGDFVIARGADGLPRELGRGGMGVTYRAVDQILHRDVALKVIALPENLHGETNLLRDRFLHEARSTASLRHPHVAEVFQFGTSPETGQAYYAMELVEGETLEERVRRDGPLPEAAALEVAVQVARALVAAAAQGLVHRDLKPANLMLSRGPSRGPLHVTVIDFGLVHAAASAGQPSGREHRGFAGTLAFASPEQLRGEATDARSDIYSLGVTLWYALTGEIPFDRDASVHRIEGHGEGKEEPPDKRRVRRGHLPLGQLRHRKVSARLVALLRSTLADDPAGRPPCAEALLAALEGCRPRRRRVAIAVGLAVVLTFTGIGWLLHRPPPASPPVRDRSIAVLPFDAFSKDDDSTLLAGGMQDEVLTDLSRVASLTVISRASTLAFRDPAQRDVPAISRALGVAYVVEGSVQRAGGSIRVTAQLIDARTDTHVWAAHYDRRLADVFAIQSEIAQAVAAQLQAIISPQAQTAMAEVPTRDEQAYQLYLRAGVRANDPGLVSLPVENARTIELLRQATARDPAFARAFTLMAEVQAMTYLQTNVPADGEQVRVYAEAVARLQPGSADAAVAMATYDYEVRHDGGRAHEEFAAVVRQLPSDARAYHYLALIERRQGRWDEAVEHDRRARELDPENDLYFKTSSTLLYGLRRFRELSTLLDRRLASHPAMVQLHLCKAAILLDWKADTHAARAELALLPIDAANDGPAVERRLLCDDYERDFAAAARDLAACPADELFDHPRGLEEANLARYQGKIEAAAVAYAAIRPAVEAEANRNPENFGRLGSLAELDAHLGHREVALEEGRRMLSLVPPGDTLDTPDVTLQWARILGFAGESDEAIRVLQSACSQPFGPITYGDLHANPDWDPLRGDPRFEAIVASLAPR